MLTLQIYTYIYIHICILLQCPQSLNILWPRWITNQHQRQNITRLQKRWKTRNNMPFEWKNKVFTQPFMVASTLFLAQNNMSDCSFEKKLLLPRFLICYGAISPVQNLLPWLQVYALVMWKLMRKHIQYLMETIPWLGRLWEHHRPLQCRISQQL